MRIVYVLLSPTFGMHIYTADLANRMARTGNSVHLVTTTNVPRDRYVPGVEIHTPVQAPDSGLSWHVLKPGEVQRALEAIVRLKPDMVHFTGPHVWNLLLLGPLHRLGIPVLHTIHDLEPHPRRGLGFLFPLWNRLIWSGVDRILVHGECYRQRLVAQGVKAERIACTPLLGLFLGGTALESATVLSRRVSYQDGVLFFGRLEYYKGLDVLLEAWPQVTAQRPTARLIIAGEGDWPQPGQKELPPGVELRNRLIGDREALELFLRCSVVVFPYRQVGQSASVGAAYFFRKPVVATRVGALPEVVEEGRTGWLVPPADAGALATALAEALSNPQRLMQMGEAARSWYDGQRLEEGETLGRLYASMAPERVI